MTSKQYQQQLALGLFGLFGILAILVKFQFAALTQVDHQLMTQLTASGLGQHVRVLNWLTFLGSPVVTGGVAVFLALWLWRTHQPRWAALCLATILSGDALLLVIKKIVARIRPANPVIADSGFSFPSGHVFSTALVVCMVLGLLWHFLGKNWLTIGVTVVLVGFVLAVVFSRLGLRAHYPSDTLGSLLLASGWWLQMLAIFNRLTARKTVAQ